MNLKNQNIKILKDCYQGEVIELHDTQNGKVTLAYRYLDSKNHLGLSFHFSDFSQGTQLASQEIPDNVIIHKFSGWFAIVKDGFFSDLLPNTSYPTQNHAVVAIATTRGEAVADEIALNAVILNQDITDIVQISRHQPITSKERKVTTVIENIDCHLKLQS